MDAYDFTALGIEFSLQHEEEEAYRKEQEQKRRSSE